MNTFAVSLMVVVFSTICTDEVRLVSLHREKPYFTAAVLAHAPLGKSTTEILSKNFDIFRKATELAKSKDADIIVFPEYSILSFRADRKEVRKYLEAIPDHKSRRWNPCEQSAEFSDRPILRTLSCMARNNSIVLVANMGDIEPCEKQINDKCPDDGAWHYNANVAFDRDGTLIGVYRKEHLYFEVLMDLPRKPQDPVFRTDFGTFAMYICFEIVFKGMALSGRNESIDGVIFSAQWIDTRPVKNAIQEWQSWSVGNDAVLIAANGQIPGASTVGSGVFAGKMGALAYTSVPDFSSKLIVSRVPRNRGRGLPFYQAESSITVITANGTEPYDVSKEDEGDAYPDVCTWDELGRPSDVRKEYRCLHEKMSNYTFVKLPKAEGNLEACNNGVCCSVTYSADSMNETFYLVVWNGTHNSLNRYFWCEEKCFIVRCNSFNGTECGTFPAKSNTVFRRLELKANFSTEFVYPSVIKSGIRLSPVNEWKYSLVRNESSYCGNLVYDSTSKKPLLVASLNGRCFNRDPPYVR